MTRYNKYDIATKLSLVEDYLKLLNDNPKLRISDYASDHNIADSTFNDWVIKYRKDINKFINGISDDAIVNLTPTVKPAFIEISKDKIIDKIESSSSTIKLNYKESTLQIVCWNSIFYSFPTCRRINCGFEQSTN